MARKKQKQVAGKKLTEQKKVNWLQSYSTVTACGKINLKLHICLP